MKNEEEIIEALDAVQEARLIVEQKIADRSTQQEERDSLEETSFMLERMERNLIKEATSKLIDELSSDADKLKSIADDINRSAKHLDDIAGALAKVSNTIEKVVKVAGVISGGL